MTRLTFCVASVVVTLLTTLAPACAQTNVNFSVGWAWQGDHSIWALAIERGFFATEKLAVKMDRGYGAGDTITKVATGVYDIGFCDINALVKFNADNPDKRVITFFQIYNKTLAAVLTTAASGIKSPKDLEGATLAGTLGEASRLLFPAFARANGVDPSKISWQSVSPQMREMLLARGQVKAMAGFTSTAYFNLKAAGVPESEIVVLPYSGYGLDLYGSGLITTAEFAEKNPEVLAAFIRATIAGIRRQVGDPKPGIAALKKRDPLLNEELEIARFELIVKNGIITEDVKANGFGTLTPERMAQVISVNAEAYKIANPPRPEDVFTTKFLPPKAQRMP
jgi:NitT/TauT family transport system substrate-binding protein